MPDLRVDRRRGRSCLVIEAAAPLPVRELVHLVELDGTVTAVGVDRARQEAEEVVLEGRARDVHVAARWRVAGPVVEVTFEVTYEGRGDLTAGLRVVLAVPGRVHQPHWLVPGAFYGINRLPECVRAYPRAVVAGGDQAALESAWWSFRSDRAALPAVLGWTDTACVGLATAARTSLGLSGVGFAVEDGSARVWLDFPYREEPVVYDGSPHPAPPDVQTHRWRPGERHRIGIRVWIAEPSPHAYDGFLRHLYAEQRADAPTAPWMSAASAARLTAHGLHRWHWRPEHDALYETAAFDRASPELDRAHMHVAWVSGAPWAAALLAYGRRVGHDPYVEAACRVLDKIAGSRAPAGCFWGMWTLERGWRGGWNPDAAWVHARTIAEATLFLARAARLDAHHGGQGHASWRRAVADNLRFAAERQDASGNLGSYYDARTGIVADRRSAAGLLWAAALVEGAALLDRPDFLAVARLAGEHYASYVEDAFVYGAPEDVHLAPTSEDAYNAVIAYMALHAADGGSRWLELARQAADWMMTFRWAYNVAFSAETLLGRYDFRSRGADQASPSNQHLHAYGLICLAELAALWRCTGDRYYLDRARDNLDCFLQFVARRDGDFNAGRGMVSERYYQTNCFQPKGSLLTLSHAWCVGVVLHGCLVALDDPEAFPTGERSDPA